MTSYSLTLVGFLLLLLGGCSAAKIDPSLSLAGKSWELSAWGGSAADPSGYAQGVPNIHFLEEGRFAGFTGCNSFSGNFVLSGSEAIELNPGAITRKACPGSGEEAFVSALEKVKNFKLEKGKLTLMDGSDELMSFVPKKD
jgi:heat shock protein HslJ